MLSDFRKILYVSDMDEGSRPAFRAAVSLCNHYDSRITYLHVIELVSSTTRGVLSNMMEKEDIEGFLQQGITKLKEKAQARIVSFCEQELEGNEKLEIDQVEVLVDEGTPWKVIIQVADEMEADVIVMGTRKKSTLGQLLLGSTAAKTLSYSKCPVMVVPLKD